LLVFILGLCELFLVLGELVLALLELELEPVPLRLQLVDRSLRQVRLGRLLLLVPQRLLDQSLVLLY
jgi:hypothetical protein